MDATQVGAALVTLSPALPAGWKAASLRGDIFHKWAARVDLAHAGLNERVTSELVQLQTEISAALGTTAGLTFTPAEVWADPDPLVTRANQCAKLLRARDKLRQRFLRHRQLGPILIPVVATYVLGWLSATLYYTGVIENDWARVFGFIFAGCAIAVGLVVFALYTYYEARLTAAEEMAAGD